MKKGVELTLNTMIIAVLLLIVAVVLVFVFTKGIGDIVPWFKAASTCEGRGDKCVDSASACTGQAIQSGCPDKAQYCCITKNEKT